MLLKKDIMRYLDDMGISYTKSMTKKELLNLFPRGRKENKKVEYYRTPEFKTTLFKSPIEVKNIQNKRDNAFLDLVAFASQGEPIKNKKEKAQAKIRELKKDFYANL